MSFLALYWVSNLQELESNLLVQGRNGCVKIMHPMVGSGSERASRCLKLSILSRRAVKSANPFLGPNASHANDTGTSECLTKKPPPAIALSGYRNLKRKSSPGLKARKTVEPPGCQKLTSSGRSCERKLYQWLSVTPIQNFKRPSPYT